MSIKENKKKFWKNEKGGSPVGHNSVFCSDTKTYKSIKNEKKNSKSNNKENMFS